jgi:serine phosphatase RsbU (regulator of sigma subunit)
MRKVYKLITSKILFEIFAFIVAILIFYTLLMNYIISHVVEKEVKESIILFSIVGLISTMSLIVLILKKALKPLEKMSNTISKVKDGNFHVRVDLDRNDELGMLSNEFDHLLDIIEKEMSLLNNKIEQKTKKLETINKHLSDSINVAFTIQNALLPLNDRFEACANDYFLYYEPKDIVSGDIYLVRRVEENKFILILADCTGHGVSGAFITMLVKAIERELLIYIKDNNHVSTSEVLNIFNSRMKDMLNQKDKDSCTLSDVGFDGGVLYIDRDNNFAQYSGANIPLFIYQNDKINIIKPDKFSIGYKRSQFNYKFNEHYLDLTNEQTIYMCSDGILDQLGGQKGFPFAKRRFINSIDKHKDLTLKKQRKMILKDLEEYQKECEQTDDRTLIALKF